MTARWVFLLLFMTGVIVGVVAGGAVNSAEEPAFPDGPGKDILMQRCFQCHNDRIWRNLKQDRQAWEGVIYRMIGRGALWTDDEIDSMTNYLAMAFGPKPDKATK
jgi:hypothetical protein